MFLTTPEATIHVYAHQWYHICWLDIKKLSILCTDTKGYCTLCTKEEEEKKHGKRKRSPHYFTMSPSQSPRLRGTRARPHQTHRHRALSTVIGSDGSLHRNNTTAAILYDTVPAPVKLIYSSDDGDAQKWCDCVVAEPGHEMCTRHQASERCCWKLK